jgi:hypothetical protein
LSLRFEFPDLLAQGIAAGLELLSFGFAAAAGFVAGDDFVDQFPNFAAAVAEAILDGFRVFAKGADVEHGGNLASPSPAATSGVCNWRHGG